MATRYKRERDEVRPRRGEQNVAILTDRLKRPVVRLDPSQPAASVQVNDFEGNYVGLGELTFTGSAFKSLSYDVVEGRVVVNVVPKFDVDVVFGSEEESFS